MPKDNPKHSKDLFIASEKNSRFSFENYSFADYITSMRHILKEIRTDGQIDANAPREFIPNLLMQNTSTQKPKGILLIHGLLDSPMSMLSLFEHYRAQNYWVRSLLLPGHGSKPGDLLHVRAEDWQAATRYAIDGFKDKVSDLCVIGVSTGAALALHQALTGAAIDKLILFAPALQLTNPLTNYAYLYQYLGKISSRLLWVNRSEEDDYAKYQSITCNSVHQVVRLSKQIAQLDKAKLSHIPQYYIVSEDDEVIDSQRVIDYYRQQNNENNRLLIYSNSTRYQDDKRIICCRSENFAQKILDYSHPCMAVAPEHPHYGQAGDYQDFSHYKNPFYGLQSIGLRWQSIYQGATSLKNLRRYHLQRLRFNPDFKNLMQRLDQFLA